MTTGKALTGKPYAGHPHVRFDEGEVASAATSRRGSLLYNKMTISRFACAATLSFAAIGTSASDVSYWFEGSKLHVRATSALAGKGLFLQTDAENTDDWTTATNFVTAVPSVGGEYTIDLMSLGIGNGTPCRIAAAAIYEKLDRTMLEVELRNLIILCEAIVAFKLLIDLRLFLFFLIGSVPKLNPQCFCNNARNIYVDCPRVPASWSMKFLTKSILNQRILCSAVLMYFLTAHQEFMYIFF